MKTNYTNKSGFDMEMVFSVTRRVRLASTNKFIKFLSPFSATFSSGFVRRLDNYLQKEWKVSKVNEDVYH